MTQNINTYKYLIFIYIKWGDNEQREEDEVKKEEIAWGNVKKKKKKKKTKEINDSIRS